VKRFWIALFFGFAVLAYPQMFGRSTNQPVIDILGNTIARCRVVIHDRYDFHKSRAFGCKLEAEYTLDEVITAWIQNWDMEHEK
jgi:hypothetical protein